MKNIDLLKKLNQNLLILQKESENDNLSIVDRTSINARIYNIKELIMKEN